LKNLPLQNRWSVRDRYISACSRRQRAWTYLGNHQAGLNPSSRLGHHDIADSSTVKPLTSLGVLEFVDATKLILILVGKRR
jgi:hypothetical protein